ncbi:hypothetical protein D9758_012226 [Tetrapyrgos nigripes]|uniref:Uncharacterized protein n=1 Tax=Tetrapyrgos nigripes TaxID=182062 RepID=A0A8H5CB05_9AGAR|nr:hypothetical protein D9758_012226 [Tetrapyrgos nigripes]
MSGNVYPSPVSSPSLSPNLESAALRSTIQSPAPGPSNVDERRHLERHLERIRNLRRNILEQGNESTSMAPGHRAIVLTGRFDEQASRLLDQSAWSRLTALLPPATMERLIEFEARRLQQPLRPANASHLHPPDTTTHVSPSSSHPTSSSHSPSLLNSPLSPPRQRLLPPRTLQDLQPLRTRDLSDDPNTLIGRRVAAREASRSSNGSSPRSGVHNLTEQEFDYIRALARQRRTEPLFYRRPESSLDVIRREAEAHHARNSIDNPAPHMSAGAPIRGQMRRALRTSRIDSRQTSSFAPSPGNRLSTLSSFSSVQNLPTPSSTTSSQRMLLFDEPASYLLPQPSSEEGRVRSTPSAELQGRTTRRVNAEGDEVVHSINPIDDTSSDFVSSPVQMLPDNVLAPGLTRRENNSDHRRDNTVQTSGYIVPASTLFGTLVDRDGNEISPDVHQISDPSDPRPSQPPSYEGGQWLFQGPPSSHLRSTIDHFEPITVTSFVPDDHPYSNFGLPPRVRINPHPRDPPDDDLDQEDEQPVQLTQSHKPLFIDPLPVPVETMASGHRVQPNKTRGPLVKVSRHANFAGR